MKSLEHTWRWYGPDDPVTLSDIHQAGATGVVTALHHIPSGEVWNIQEINRRKRIIEEAGLTWSVVESLPVSEAIKTRSGPYREHLEAYRQSLRNLAFCKVHTVTYNFMPVVEWTRTDLDFIQADGSTALRYHQPEMTAFDIYLLRRPGAAADYTAEQLEAASDLYHQQNDAMLRRLIPNILAGLPGSEAGYSLDKFQHQLDRYQGLNEQTYREHLIEFLRTICTVADDEGIKLAIHPDDPPFGILGLPRIVSTQKDLQKIFEAVPNPSNGVCFCTGSFGARPDNNLLEMINQFSDRIHFLHLRSTKTTGDKSFFEANHLNGDVDMYAVMKAVLEEQQERLNPIPMRPDHGHKMLDDLQKQTYPGYSAIGRLRGLAELRGLEMAILRSHTN